MRCTVFHIFWNPNPELFQITSLNISLHWYGVMWALGLFLSREVGLYIFTKDRRYMEHLPTLFFYIVIPGILGARIGHFLFYSPEILFTNPLALFTPPFAGMASHGGVAGILLGVWIFCRKHHWNYLWIIDRLSIVALLPGVTIRVGNLINSEMIGIPVDLPWSFIFVKVDYVPRHPAQLYEAVAYLLLFLIFFYVWKRYSTLLGNGFFIGAILITMWTCRFFIEFVKMDQVNMERDYPINLGQVLSIPFIITGLIILYFSFKKGPDPYYFIS